MGDKINDGGPAFPFLPTQDRHSKTPGMSLRDWFAGQALAGFATDKDYDTLPGSSLARDAYAIADAMLAQRTKENG